MANSASFASHGQRDSAVVKWLNRLDDDRTPSNRESCVSDLGVAQNLERARGARWRSAATAGTGRALADTTAHDIVAFLRRIGSWTRASVPVGGCVPDALMSPLNWGKVGCAARSMRGG